jgi:hypothetical protein
MNSEVLKDVGIEEGMYWLFHALIVCAQTYEQNIAMLDDEQKLKDTCKQFTDHLIKVMREEPGWNIYAKLLLFKKYLAFHFSIPIYEEENARESKPSGIDWTHGIYTVLKQHLGYSESEILNMPFRKLFYEWCSVAESNGAIKVSNRTSLTQIAIAKGLIKTDFKYNSVVQRETK